MSDGFIILRPVKVDDAKLVSSTVPEDDFPVYDPDETYALGAPVMWGHAVYESADDGNQGHDPASSPTKWNRVRATNRWRCLADHKNSSRTAQPTAISYVLQPDQAIGMAAVTGLVNCTSVSARLIDEDYGVVYEESADTGPVPGASDWWEFFFGEWAPARTVFLFDGMPAFPSARLHIDLEGGPDLALGPLLMGQPREWGYGPRYGARVGRQGYSARDVNKYGDFELVKRVSAKRASLEVVIDSNEVDPLLDFLDEIDAVVCLFVGSRRVEASVIVGIYMSHEVLLENALEATLDIEILGAA